MGGRSENADAVEDTPEKPNVVKIARAAGKKEEERRTQFSFFFAGSIGSRRVLNNYSYTLERERSELMTMFVVIFSNRLVSRN